MNATALTTAVEHIPVFFPAGTETLFGVYTRPVHSPRDVAVLISSGGLTGTSTVGRNQMFVRLAQRLAADGFPALRFDYHGIGESTGVLDEFRLDAAEPFVDDIVGAGRRVHDLGARRQVLLGKCFGSRMALSAAAALDHLDAVVLIGAPVRDFGKGERAVTRLADQVSIWDGIRRVLRPAFLRGLTDQRRRKTLVRAARAKARALSSRIPGQATPAARQSSDGVSRRFIEPLEALMARGVPVQLIYGRDDDFYREFLAASQRGRLARLLAEHAGLVEITVTPGQVRGFVQCEVQDAIIDAACTWIARRSGEGAHPAPAGT
ncbi:MAG TPA: alpha/beta fold hydrolase [Acidimicrobiales bacterium]|nr:alpha/beta fold hydrolase [Acidimicrobiales bacterium]